MLLAVAWRVAAQTPLTPDAHIPTIAVAMGSLAKPQVRAVVQSGSRVSVGGNFDSIGGVARNNLAAFDADTGQIDPAWNR